MKVTSIHIYPIKSLGGVSLPSCKLTTRGLALDRRYMLVDEDYQFLTQREFAEMALFTIQLDRKFIIVHYGSDSIVINSEESGDWLPKRVKVWSSLVKANGVNKLTDEWFSERLNKKCTLAYMPDASKRTVNPFYGKGEIVSFADGYPYLLANEKSLEQLNDKLETPITMDRFRANIIVDGKAPFEEDDWVEFSIGKQEFTISKKCARCPVVNIDPKTGLSSKEVLKTLSTFRKQNNKVRFGTNFCWKSKELKDPFIKVGDKVEVISKKTDPK